MSDTFKFGDEEYSVSQLSDTAKQQIINIQFVDEQIQRISSEIAVADTARIGYSHAIKAEVSKLNQD
jgi:hypothetical protein